MRRSMTKILTILFIFPIILMSMGVSPMRMSPRMQHHGMGFVENEYDFLVHMIPHHEEAVRNAEILRENTERSEMRDFAEEIMRNQQEEIDLMREWLMEWYPDQSHDVEYRPMMGDYEGLTGDEMDQAFLEDMIPHHMDAVRMSQQLLRHNLAEHEEVEDLALTIRTTQMEEIHQMSFWLNEWFGENRDSFQMMPMRRTGRGFFQPPWTPFILGGMGILLILAILFKSKKNDSEKTTNPREILDQRYARGEMTEEEYRNARKNLEE